VHNHYRIFDAMTAILTGDKPTQQHWCELANACNVLEALRQQRKLTDPEQLIVDAFEALLKARERTPIRFDGVGREAVLTMIDNYLTCCRELPERTIKSAVNYAYNAQQHRK
jgi:hypothetical protein